MLSGAAARTGRGKEEYEENRKKIRSIRECDNLNNSNKWTERIKNREYHKREHRKPSIVKAIIVNNK